MNWSHPYLGLFGLLGGVFWTLRYFYFFKKAELFLPSYIGDNQRSQFIVRTLYLFGLTSWVLMSVSLMGPRKSIGFANRNIEVRDIFFVIDVSRSMLANDFAPNRLEASKKKILEFVDMRPHDRIGLIIFSEKVYTLLPLSFDLELVKSSIKDIKIGFLGSGTNIGDALGLAIARESKSPTKTKIVVLLTDGVSNVGLMTPIQAAEIAKEHEIKVYTIGIGGGKDARLPVGNPTFGGKQRYQRIPGGSIDLETLKSMARITGGKDFFAGEVSSLKNVFNEIEKLEKTKIKSIGHIIYKELYLKYLILSLLLLVGVEIFKKILLRDLS